MNLIILAEYRDWVLLAARLVLGITFLYYGWPKIKDLKSNAEDFEAMGFKPGWFWGTPVALLESVGSVLVILGFYVSILGVLFALHMLTGMVWKITKTEKPFTDWSYDLTLLALGLVLAGFGSGAIAVF